jgi:hypothetical protein
MKNFKKLLVIISLPLLYFMFVTGFNSIKTVNNPSAAFTITGRYFFNYVLNTNYSNNACFWDVDYEPDKKINYFKELNFNGVHHYDEGSTRIGEFNVQLTGSQINAFNTILTTVHGEPYNMKSMFERVNISQLCYAQRLVYEISQYGGTTENYGFCYKDVMGITYDIDNGRTVLHPVKQINQPGFIAENIYENIQHTDLYFFRPSKQDLDEWYVKPVMRINLEDFSPTSDVPVVRIDIIRYDNTLLKSVDIRIRNFRNENFTYDGGYKEIYNFDDEYPHVDLIASGNLTDGLNEGYTGNSPDNSKVDFKVYWYGYVDVWFDKMIVDDKYANTLFKPAPNNYDSLIIREVQNFGNSHDIFFADEILSANAYSIKYVQDKMHEYNSNSKLQVALSNYLNIYSHRNDELLSKMVLEIAKPEYVCLDVHNVTWAEITAGGIPVNSFNDLDSRIPDCWKKDNITYNNYLQNIIIGKKDEIAVIRQGSIVWQINQTKKSNS